MSAAHVHLILNHIPLLGFIFGTVLLAYGLWRTEEGVQKASLGLIAVAGLSTIAVYLTGEPAEEVVEGLAGVSHDAIEAHEEVGIYGLIAGIATGVIALGALGYSLLRLRIVRWTAWLSLVLALLSTGVMGYTANLGGKISHPELRGERATTVDEEEDQSSVREDHTSAEDEEEEEG